MNVEVNSGKVLNTARIVFGWPRTGNISHKGFKNYNKGPQLPHGHYIPHPTPIGFLGVPLSKIELPE